MAEYEPAMHYHSAYIKYEHVCKQLVYFLTSVNQYLLNFSICTAPTWQYKAPKDYTKPRHIIRIPKKIIQRHGKTMQRFKSFKNDILQKGMPIFQKVLRVGRHKLYLGLPTNVNFTSLLLDILFIGILFKSYILLV